MGAVYRAVHRLLERPVAIKVLHPSLRADPTFPLRFLREAKTVAHLEHPNIIGVHDFDDDGWLAWLVMELATGGTFRDQSRGFKTLGAAVAGLVPVGEA